MLPTILEAWIKQLAASFYVLWIVLLLKIPWNFFEFATLIAMRVETDALMWNFREKHRINYRSSRAGHENTSKNRAAKQIWDFKEKQSEKCLICKCNIQKPIPPYQEDWLKAKWSKTLLLDTKLLEISLIENT